MSDNNSNTRNTLSDAEAKRSVEDFFGDNNKEDLKMFKEGYDFGIKNGLKRVFASKNEE